MVGREAWNNAGEGPHIVAKLLSNGDGQVLKYLGKVTGKGLQLEIQVMKELDLASVHEYLTDAGQCDTTFISRACKRMRHPC